MNKNISTTKKNAPDIYNNLIGTNALRVLDDDPWGEDTGAEVQIRVVSDRKTNGAGNAGGDSD